MNAVYGFIFVITLAGGSSAAGMPKIVKGGICAQKGNLSCPKMVWGSYENTMLRVPGLATAVKEVTGKEAISSDATGEVAKNSSSVLDQREMELPPELNDQIAAYIERIRFLEAVNKNLQTLIKKRNMDFQLGPRLAPGWLNVSRQIPPVPNQGAEMKNNHHTDLC